MRQLAIVALLSAALPASAAAQHLPESVWKNEALTELGAARAPLFSNAAPASTDARAAPGFIDGVRRWAGLAKWFSLAGTVAVGGLGFEAHNEADLVFARLERLCEEDAARCRLTTEGTYVDPEAEALFQEVLDKDDVARIYLGGSQVAFVATVALFVLDLKNEGGPENIPYEPENVRLQVSPGELRLAWFP